MACGFAGDGPSAGPVADATAVAEKEYAGASEVSSSSASYPGSYAVHGGRMVEGEEEEEEEEELQLGLSLGSSKKMADGGEGERRGAAWWERCRILTAEDLPSRGSRVGVASSPVSSSSSVSSSSTTPAGGGNEEKRIPDNPPGSQTVVGWPPVRSYRINSLVNQSKDNASSNETAARRNKMTEGSKIHKAAECICAEDNEKKPRLAGNSLLVKVNLDGDQIGRKVDLSAHLSYETLASALETMFYKLRPASCNTKRTSSLLDGSSGFALTYEDKDGDWMLVGDVPWGMFLNNVKRIRIMRTSDTNGLVARFPSSLAGVELRTAQCQGR